MEEKLPLNRESSPTKATTITDANKANLLSYLATNQQILLETIYFTQTNTDHKTITDSMKSVILKPLEEIIEKDETQQIQNNKKPPLKKYSDPYQLITDWLANKKQLSYKEFCNFLSQSSLDNEIITLAKKTFLLRFINDYADLIDLQNLPPSLSINKKEEEELNEAAYDRTFPSQRSLEDLDKPLTKKPKEEFSEEENSLFDQTLKKLKKIRVLTKLINNIDIDVDTLTKIFQISQLDITIKELDIIKNSLEEVLTKLEDQPEKKDIAIYLKKILENNISKKTDEIDKTSTTLPSAEELEEKIKQLAEQLNNNLQPALDYLISLTKGQGLENAPKVVLKIVNRLRIMLPNVANTELIAFFWWHLRLGGERSKYLRKILDKYYPNFSKKIEKYINFVFDHLLSSEASSFELEKDFNYEGVIKSPNQLIFEIIKCLIRYHIPKDQNHLRFTLLDGEKRIRKIIINYRKNMTDNDIREQIDLALKNTSWQEISITEEERLRLSYLGQHSKQRIKDPKYQKIYYGFGNNEKHEPFHGDYLIQIGSVYHDTRDPRSLFLLSANHQPKVYYDTRDPRSLFAVNSHQIAIRLAFEKAGKVKITSRFNHQYFDGMPALTHFQQILNDLNNPSTDYSNFFANEEKKFEDYFSDKIKNLQLSEKLEKPKIEGVYESSITIDKETGEKIKSLFPGFSLPTSLQFAIAQANNLEYFQFLVAGKELTSLSKLDPNLNNVQPVAVAFDNGKIKEPERLKQSIERAKNGVGDIATISAIAGTKELPLSIMGKMLNKKLTQILRNSQGMISFLTSFDENIFFSTAFSDAYTPEEIDLNNPSPHIGIIGINSIKDENGNLQVNLKVRILPSQAQYHFRQAILEEIKNQTNNETLNFQTEKIKQSLSIFNDLFIAWNRLVSGEKKQYISYDQYQKIRRQTLDKLKNIGIFTEYSEEDLQEFLNNQLQKAAKNVVVNFKQKISSL